MYEVEMLKPIKLVSREAAKGAYLIHYGRDRHGDFARIVAGNNHSIGDAALVMSSYGCRANRNDHELKKAEDVVLDECSFASWYTKYNMPVERLQELKQKETK